MGLVSFTGLRDQDFPPSTKGEHSEEASSTITKGPWEHSEESPSIITKGTLTRHFICRDLTSDFPASNTGRNLCWIGHPDSVHCYNSLVQKGISCQQQWFRHLGGPPLIPFPSWGRQLNVYAYWQNFKVFLTSNAFKRCNIFSSFEGQCWGLFCVVPWGHQLKLHTNHA